MTAADPGARARGLGPRVLLESRSDSASVNIATRLRAAHAWEDAGRSVDGHAVSRLVGVKTPAPVFLATIEGLHIHEDGIGERLAAALGVPVEVVLVLSRHRAASGQPSFTAHPVGNPGPEAVAGGVPRSATPTHPHVLTAAFRGLVRHAEAAHLPHGVSFESTHHGPLSAVPVVYIEIGSDERHYEVEAAGEVVARAAMDAVMVDVDDPVVFGIGGGHYAPRFGPLVRELPVSMGHMLANYHWREGQGNASGGGSDRAPGGVGDHAVPREVLAAFLRASAAPGRDLPDAVYVDRKSLPAAARRGVMEDLEALGVPVMRTGALRELVGSRAGAGPGR